MWPFWRVAPLLLAVVGALSFGLYHGVYALLSDAAASQRPSKPVNINDVIKTSVTVLTLTGAVLAGLYAYRKQLLAEGDAHRADASQLADRYTTAAGQVGHDEAAVRLAGVYALARLADDWEEQRQVCIDVLCAYLRMPYELDPSAPGHMKGEREVRQTIIRVIRDHLRQPGTPTAWCECDFDFTGATFDGGDFSRSHFRGTTDFSGATFSNGTVSFREATFRSGSTYVSIDFHGATFSGARVSFYHAMFSGLVEFGDVMVSGGTVNFDDARFDGGTVSFEGATLSGGTVSFSGLPPSRMTFEGTMVDFSGATFNGGTVDFDGATFYDPAEGVLPLVSFDGATFSSGNLQFGRATFNASFNIASVTFALAKFNGAAVTFYSTTFNGGTVSFGAAMFNGGMVSFDGATFSRTTFDFGGARFNGTAFEWGTLPIPTGAG
ncbi:pentapeptide repeat-containing protein [Streptomyces sp. NBC_00038]|uniref:pentapeptide repeat-containing protein n=1 Tax=Streptomyces sp. NBC_00038 TaxID=2903615 RepID=UPI00225941A4|nr:pentapeptide repeat-containing protein [Streptomyces sp. NBC_00038]MCX5559481.1 pentapeptide repeat-containing protein [Streptomyces sp. NBC_00038]